MAFWEQWRKRPPVVFQAWQAPDWKNASVEDCLEKVRTYAEAQAAAEIRWYQENIRHARRASRVLRRSALTLTALGSLVPMLSSMRVLDPLAVWFHGVLLALQPGASPAATAAPNPDLSQLGYLFLALAGAFVLFDRFFGYSTAWMRYVATMIEMEKLREAFRGEWVLLSQRWQAQNDAAFVVQLIDVARTFTQQVKEATAKETQAWISEFQTNLSQSEKEVRERMESNRPGGIEVQVSDGAKAVDGFDLAVDQMRVEHITGTSGSIGFIAPGLHKISVSTSLAGKTYAASQIVEVPPAAVKKVELALGIP